LRTSQYRLIEHRAEPGEAIQIERYDAQEGPLETLNIAAERTQIDDRLLQQLREERPKRLAPNAAANEAPTGEASRQLLYPKTWCMRSQ